VGQEGIDFASNNSSVCEAVGCFGRATVAIEVRPQIAAVVLEKTMMLIW